jgi:hypothetical protein
MDTSQRINPAPVYIRSVPLQPLAPLSANVGITSTLILFANPSRTSAVFINRSLNVVSFAIDFPAILNAGITLIPNGVWVMDPYTLATGTIFAIASASSSVVAIQEYQ